MNNSERIKNALPEVIAWYSVNRRSLPWRDDPSPYHIWISEIMLQQTRIEAVIPYYRRFLQELPDIPALAAVPEDRLLKLWEGLGYYSRARNLKKAAALVMEQYSGTLPRKAEELKKLPGIGDYTAASIASIAYGESEPAVDGNVLRLVMRLLALPDDIADLRTKKKTAELLRPYYPSGREASLLTEGLMELGEVVCLPNGTPACAACPLHSLCLAHEAGKELRYPVKSAQKERRLEERTILLLRSGCRFAIRKRPPVGILAGLWEFPGYDGRLSASEALQEAEKLGVCPSSCSPCGVSKHVFTHIEWRMTGYLLSCACQTDDLLWLSPEEISAGYSIPTALRFWQRKAEEISRS